MKIHKISFLIKLLAFNFPFILRKFFISFTLIICIEPLVINAYGNPAIGKVLILKGHATMSIPEKQVVALSKGDNVFQGAVVKTKEKSFIRIKLKDTSILSLGPDSSMTIDKMKKGSVGLIRLIEGRIRAQVKKEESGDKDKSKFIIRTKNTALGVRGTDFTMVANRKLDNLSSTLVFSGEVKILKLEDDEKNKSYLKEDEINELDESLNGRNSKSPVAGEMVQVNDIMEIPTESVRISPAQFFLLKKNSFSFNKDNFRDKKSKNILPPIVATKSMANSGLLEKRKVVSVLGKRNLGKIQTKMFKKIGRVQVELDSDTHRVRHADGGIISLNSGIYFPPDSTSAYDPNLNIYQNSSKWGHMDPHTGEYRPPVGFVETPKGLVEVAQMERRPLGQGQEKPPAGMPGKESGEKRPSQTTRKRPLIPFGGTGSFREGEQEGFHHPGMLLHQNTQLGLEGGRPIGLSLLELQQELPPNLVGGIAPWNLPGVPLPPPPPPGDIFGDNIEYRPPPPPEDQNYRTETIFSFSVLD